MTDKIKIGMVIVEKRLPVTSIILLNRRISAPMERVNPVGGLMGKVGMV